MGTRERRQREVARREAHILETAQRLIRDEGLLNLQMSRLAEACDYAVGTLYQHFARKEDLLVALDTRNALQRITLFERAAAWRGPTRERMLAIALADILITSHRPDVFRLSQFVYTEVVWTAASPERRRQALAVGEPLERVVTGIVDDALACGDLPRALTLSPMETVLGLWTQCIGMHSLMHLDDALPAHDVHHPYRLLFRHLNHLLNGYGWQPLMPRVDEDVVLAQMQRLCREVFGQALPSYGDTGRDATPGRDPDSDSASEKQEQPAEEPVP
jgi:AcrR family transcriptional regulator